MDFTYILDFIYEFAYFLGIFLLFMVFAVFKGRQAIINVIFGLYFALLITTEFPQYDKLFSGLETVQSIAAAKLGFFAFVTLLTTALSWRVMPDEFQEERFESLGKKLLLAFAATTLVLAFSFQVLPLNELLSTGTPIQSLFAPEQYFFWWLLLPLVILFFI
jgi:hypothetical protein